MNARTHAPLPESTLERRCAAYLIQPGHSIAEGVGAEILGAKAWNLARMASLDLPVPPAFVLGTGWCSRPSELASVHWQPALDQLERLTALRLGDPKRPLLVSVRSGAPVSMPGMMETLLNIGLTDATLPGFIRVSGHPRLAWDAYRRLISGYGEVVAGIDAQHFESDLDEVRGAEDERSLDFTTLRILAARHLDTYRREAGEAFPQDAHVQLEQSIKAVFASWNAEKARTYRSLHGLSDQMGTAVTVQRMVFGNGGGLSGAGVGFSRNPSSGEPLPWVDFLFNAQGEDVVSGRRNALGHDQLAAVAPQVWQALLHAIGTLENVFGDMQDFEFTVQDGQLFLLQTRNGKRTSLAAARIALDLHDDGQITTKQALERTRDLDAHNLAQHTIAAADGAELTVLGRASSAANGVACGEIVLDEAAANARHRVGAPVILVRQDAETRDIGALDLAEGLLTQRGARTSHAAVVARHLGKVCLVGCESLQIDTSSRSIRLQDRFFREGDYLTLDGNEGVIYGGQARVVTTLPHALLERLERLRTKPGA